MFIEIKGLHASYGATPILHDINVSLEEGRCTGIIGPNGSGKSTLLKCLYRVVKPTTGDIIIDGKNLASISYRDSAKKTSVLMQHHSDALEITALDVVLMARNPYKGVFEAECDEDYVIAKTAMEETGVASFQDFYFSELSGGEQQRVMLARAIAQQTPCLILDEPTNHLDITYQIQIMNLIVNRKLTIVAAIHDLNIASMYCDDIIAMKDGHIIEKGPTKTVLTTQLIETLYGVKASIVDYNGRSIIVYERG